MRSISLPHIRVADANSLPTLTQLFSSHMSPASSNSELGALPTKPPQVGRVLNCPPLIPGHMRHQYAPPPLAGYLFLCCNRSRHVSDENTCCVFPQLFFSSSPRSDSNSRANISETMFEVRPQQATRKATKTPKQATRTRMQWVCVPPNCHKNYGVGVLQVSMCKLQRPAGRAHRSVGGRRRA